MTQSQPISAEDVVPHDDTSHQFDKDSPLRGDIRLLGRLLGDTIREQEGVDTFDLVERIRTTSVRFHRDADDAARQELRVTPKWAHFCRWAAGSAAIATEIHL